MIKNNNDEMHLSVEPVCSFAGQSAAFPPIADPCQMSVGVAVVPEGTHSLAGKNTNTCYSS